MIRVSPQFTSTQEVFAPKCEVSPEHEASAPRTPQNRKEKSLIEPAYTRPGTQYKARVERRNGLSRQSPTGPSEPRDPPLAPCRRPSVSP